MSKSWKPLSGCLKASIGMFVGGIAAYEIASFLDNGAIDRIVDSGQPLLMNTGPQMMMVIGAGVALVGLLLAAHCEQTMEWARTGPLSRF